MKNFIFTALMIVLVSCGTVQKKADTPADSVIAGIDNINKKPEFIRANVSVNITMERMSSLNVSGVAYLQNEPLKVRVNLIEPIFKSTVMDLLADDDRVVVLFPIDQKAQIIKGGLTKESLNRVIDSRLFIAYAFTCKVPIISDYKVSDYQISSKNIKIMLESSEMQQEINLYDDAVKKVIITDKKSSKKYTIIYNRMFKKEGYTFFKSITAYISGTNEKVTVYYNRISTDPKFNADNIFNISIPKGTTIIR
ncbi:MAG: hypothetical protein JXR90_12470 [Spirochaetes bacterium]|nr:hypothetical protein [Spirochaetota bacterium]